MNHFTIQCLDHVITSHPSIRPSDIKHSHILDSQHSLTLPIENILNTLQVTVRHSLLLLIIVLIAERVKKKRIFLIKTFLISMGNKHACTSIRVNKFENGMQQFLFKNHILNDLHLFVCKNIIKNYYFSFLV